MEKVSKKVVIFTILFVLAVLIFGKFFFKRGDFGEVDDSISILNSFENNDHIDENFISNDEGNSDKIVIYVTGAVKCEGVYELDKNSRVADCIKLAGGVTEEADLKGINLAFLLEDGAMVCIPKKGETSSGIEDFNDNWIYDGSGELYIANGNSNGTGSSGNSKNNSNKKVNINTASQSELESLPGVGSATALKIIEYRKQNGKFKCIEDIKKVKGIGDSKFSKIMSLIVV